ncbi:speckle-type POZ protein-like [Paramacrobiotus metropolitanus]|uniref:speckle-type POZ protein-like n=1 Tax=Paramacrobiotus metropolitanus TaxID=2943436 RepID=UPI0024461BCA|nr:speckle-type POZ protein-like [Paramacrobiotus metropolitanus]
MDVQVREPLFSPEFFLTTNTYQFGSSQFVSNAYLLGKGNQAGVIKDDMITIIMDVTIYKQPTTVTVVPPVLPMRALSSKEFLNRQVALSCSGRDNHSDFVLRSSDGKLFPVHGFLLMAHSPVFEAMLSHDSREKQQSQCDLADVDSESVEILVNYLYGCQAERVNINNAEKVLIMADKYQILDLRAVCEALLSETLDVDSMMERYILASHRGLDVLKNAALRVIGRNMQTVLKDDGMRAAMQSDPGLLSVIVEYYEKYCR